MKTYDVLSQFVIELNGDLQRYYRNCADFSENSKYYQESKQFFY